MRHFSVYHVPSSSHSEAPYLSGRALPADAAVLFTVEEEGPHTAWAAVKERATENRETPMGETAHWQMYDA